MDFRSPQCVIDALTERSRYGVFGYSDSGDDYFEVLRTWFGSRFGWHPKPEWLVKTPGVVFAVTMAIRALTKAGEAVLIQEPVYYPFREAIRSNGRKVVVSRLRFDGGAYSIDYGDFERKIAKNQVRLFILCSPHNPVGRVWAREELERMGDICREHGVLVVSDEIHADFVYPGTGTLFLPLPAPAFLIFPSSARRRQKPSTSPGCPYPTFSYPTGSCAAHSVKKSAKAGAIRWA
jgi:cystathionine beta-lyase